MANHVSAGAATILVVDDNEANRALARDTLEDEGHRVILANGGRAALEALERETPDCVLLDVRMPDIDGLEACRRIRALPSGRELPVIFLTALRDVDTFDQALAVGADDFLTKPVRPPELIARVQTLLKLRQMRAELREHYELLKRQRDDLMRLQLQKERLTAFVVHDLKNPVNSMDLHAQLLLRDPGLSSQARNSAMHIRDDARQLARMIVNLLDLSKGDEGKLSANRANLSLGPLVVAIVTELAVNAEARNVGIETSVEVEEIYADADLLRRLLSNLVENAIRHAPPGTAVKVMISGVEGAIELSVADSGPGVPVALRERIFEPFVQIEGSGRPETRAGRGLGLAFCRLAAAAHEGTIRIEDASPGAVFRVRLPRASPP